MGALDQIRVGAGPVLPAVAAPPAARRLPAVAPRAPIGVRPRPRGNLAPISIEQRVASGQSHRDDRRSFLGQLKDTFTGIIPGVAHLAKQGAVEAAAPIRHIVGAVQGDGPSVSDAFGAWNPMQTAVDSFIGRNDPDAENLHPLTSGVGASMRNTYEDIIHPTRFARAWDEGRIVSKVLEDAGNVALVGGLAAKGLGAGATAASEAGNLARAETMGAWANRAERVAQLGNRVGDAPINAPVSVLRRLGVAGRDATISGFDAARAGRFGDTIQTAADAVHERAPMLTTEVGRYLRANRRKIYGEGVRAESGVVKKIRTAEEAGNISPAEQGAVSAVRNGLAWQLRELAAEQGITIEEARQQLVLKDVPEQTLTADIAATAIDYLDRRLPAEDMARLDKYAGVIDDVLATTTDRALAGVGRPGGPLDPAQLGDDPNLASMDANLRKEGFDGFGAVGPDGKWYTRDQIIAIIDADPATEANFPDVNDLEQLVEPDAIPLLNDMLDDPMNWPRPWRPSMVAAQNARMAPVRELDAAIGEARGRLAAADQLGDRTLVESIHDEISDLYDQRDAALERVRVDPPPVPIRPTDQLAAGAERPGYQPGGRSDLVYPTTKGTGRVPIREGIRGIGDVRSTKTAVASEFQPYSGRTLAERVGQEARATTVNQATHDLFTSDKVPTVADVIPADRLTQLRLEADTLAQTRVGRAGPQAVGQARTEILGQMIEEELRTVHQMDVILGDRGAIRSGDWNPDRRVPFAEINEASSVLPAGLKDRLIPYVRGKDMGRVMNTLAKINSKFKGLVLPFSVRWQLGDAVGGAFMAWVGGGVPPWELIDSMRTIKNVDEAGAEAIFAHKDFQDSGLNLEDARWQRRDAGVEPPTTGLGKAWRKAGDARRASFKVNEAINRVNRQGYVLAKLQRLLERHGLDLEGVQASAAWDLPEVQTAIQKAVDDANRVMGTFDEMSPFERNYVRNVFPFWAWNRHITQLAWRTAVDNPARMMWTMRLGDYGAQQEAGTELLPWQSGSIGVGGRLLPTNFINPFNDVAGGSIYTPAGASRSLAPGIKMFAAMLGKDANRGMADLTRPYDGEGLDELGRPGGFRLNLPIPGMGASAFAYNVLRQFPQTRELLNVAPTGEIGRLGLGPHPRYGTGEFMVNRGADPIDTDSRWQSLFGLLGLRGSGDTPLLGSTADNEQIIAQRDKRRAEAARRAGNTIRFSDR